MLFVVPAVDKQLIDVPDDVTTECMQSWDVKGVYIPFWMTCSYQTTTST